MKIQTMAEVEIALRPFLEEASRTVGKNMTVQRTERLMTHIGHPERKLRIVHVAGTSGKTSTTYYIAALLAATGKKVGHTVSPHIDSLTERVQIDGVPLSEKKFCVYMEEFLAAIADLGESPTWFECMIAFALWVFAKEQVEYAVLETGLGGLHDSTNVADRSDKLCIITDIGLDHTQILGDTLEKIAYQKVGIVHDGNTVLMYEQAPEIMNVIRYWVSQHEGVELLTFDQRMLSKVSTVQIAPSMSKYQQRNWLLAFAAYSWLARRDGLAELSVEELDSTQSIQVPGRMDVSRIDGKTVVMDGAHNGQKTAAFWSSFSRLHPGKKPVVLLALKQGKEIVDIAPLLKAHAREVIVTTFTHTQDMPQASIEPSEIVQVLRKYDIKCSSVPDMAAAYQTFIEMVTDVGVVTGSFYLIAELRALKLPQEMKTKSD